MRAFAFLVAALAVAALIPTTDAAKPGGGPPSLWILEGNVVVSDGSDGAPCAETAAATLFVWVQSWSANFQLVTAGGCEPLVTTFEGQGDMWGGYDLVDLLVPLGSSGTIGGFADNPEPVPFDLRQTLPDGRSLHISGDFVVVF